MRVLWRNQAGQGAYTVSDLTAEKVCKHTPGPWKLDDDDAVIGITDDGGNIVCLGPEGWEKSMARWEANARLIAAAPEMHELLMTATAAGHTARWQERRRALLKRIDGEAP